jgi:hypothetical protein
VNNVPDRPMVITIPTLPLPVSLSNQVSVSNIIVVIIELFENTKHFQKQSEKKMQSILKIKVKMLL